MAKRPFREPAISPGYPLDEEESRAVRDVARSRRYAVRPKDGGWEIRREGSWRASAKAATQAEALARARDLARRAGGGEIIVHAADGRIRDRNTVGPSDPLPPSR
jgi:hypothetical protein